MILLTVHLLCVAFLALPYSTSAKPLSLYVRGATPNLAYFGGTAKDCTFWYDNDQGLTCAAVAAMYQVSSADMAKWNPTLTDTCGHWEAGFSYCVEVSNTPSTTTSIKPTRTRVATQPTWTSFGCYVDSSTLPALSTRASIIGGDTAMTIEGCETACYKLGFIYAGVEAGSQCWCGSYIASNLHTSTTECDTPCTGNAAQICGGPGRMNIYQGVLPPVATYIATSTTITSPTYTTATVKFSLSGAAADVAKGEIPHIAGSAPELGSWDFATAVPMAVSGSFWEASVSFALGQYAQYKYYWVSNTGTVSWNSEPNFVVVAPATCSVSQEVKDVWR